MPPSFLRRGRKPVEFFFEALVIFTIQVSNHLFPFQPPLLPPLIHERIQSPAFTLRKCTQVSLCAFHENIQVTHTAQGPASSAQLLERFPDGPGLEIIPTDIKGSAHPAGRHAHIMKFFDIFAQAGPRFVADHVRKMETQYLSPSFGHRIRRSDARFFSYPRIGYFSFGGTRDGVLDGSRLSGLFRGGRSVRHISILPPAARLNRPGISSPGLHRNMTHPKFKNS